MLRKRTFMFKTGLALLLDDPAPDALQAGRVVATVVFPDLPGDGLCPSRIGRFGQAAAEVFDLVDRLQRGRLVAEQALVVRIFPTRVALVVRIADTVVFDPLADLHHVFLQILESAGKVAMDHRLGRGIANREDHRGILAGRILRFVVLRLQVTAVPVQLDHRVLPSLGNAFTFSGQYGDSIHV